MRSLVFIPAIWGTFAATTGAVTLPSPFLLGGEYQLEADIDDGGSFTRAVARTRASAPLYLGEDFFLALTVSYQFEAYNFDGFVDDPWSDLNRSRIGLVAKQDLNDSWSWIAVSFLAADNENDADLGNSLTGGIGLVGLYRFNETLKVGLGVRVGTRLEDSISILPFPIIDWDFAEDWTFTTAPPDGFNVGAGVSLRWRGIDDLSLSLVYQFQSDNHRLANSSAAGFEDSIDGLGEFRQSRVAFVATYEFTENLFLTGHAGFTFGGEIRIEDDDGDTLERSDFDTSFVFGIEGTINF